MRDNTIKAKCAKQGIKLATFAARCYKYGWWQHDAIYKPVKPHKRPCMCVETGEKFQTVREASAKYGKVVSYIVGKDKDYKGLHFVYLT